MSEFDWNRSSYERIRRFLTICGGAKIRFKFLDLYMEMELKRYLFRQITFANFIQIPQSQIAELINLADFCCNRLKSYL